MKVLLILTSHDALGDTGQKRGFRLEAFAAPCCAFREAGADVVLASPKGGQPPLDPSGDTEDARGADTRRSRDDVDARAALRDAKVLWQMGMDGFDAVFHPGGHGPLWDLAEDAGSRRILEAFAATGRPVGPVCHAPGAFRHARGADGASLVCGKVVTGVANAREEAVGLTNVVPFLLEGMLRENAADCRKGEDRADFSVTDGTLVTGRNPASSASAARDVMALAV